MGDSVSGRRTRLRRRNTFSSLSLSLLLLLLRVLGACITVARAAVATAGSTPGNCSILA